MATINGSVMRRSIPTSRLRQYRNPAARLLVRDHLAHLGEQLLGVEHDAVLDRVLHAADAMRLAVLSKSDMAGAIQDLEIGERIFFEYDEIGELARFDRTQALVLAERLRAVQRGRADHLERMEASLAQQFQFLNRAETGELKDEAGIRTDRHAPAAVLVVVDEVHPAPIVGAPGDLVLAAPVEEEAAVM